MKKINPSKAKYVLPDRKFFGGKVRWERVYEVGRENPRRPFFLTKEDGYFADEVDLVATAWPPKRHAGYL